MESQKIFLRDSIIFLNTSSKKSAPELVLGRFFFCRHILLPLIVIKKLRI
jgi:hypothetical protein